MADAKALLPSSGGKGTKGGGKKVKPKAPKPGPLFKDLSLETLGDKVQAILVELRQLDLARFPNAAAVLTRAVVELSIDQNFAARSWDPKQTELKNRLRRCLREIDPTDRAPEFQGVRTGLQDGSSYLAVATLHGFVHNAHFHPTAADLRQFAMNFEPFLRELNDGAA